MKRFLLLLFLAATLLAACVPATAQPTNTPFPTSTPEPTKAPTITGSAAATVAATPAPTGNPGTAAKVTFKIVPGESKVSYEIAETFLNQSNRLNIAVGVTSQISGEIFADKTNPSASSMGPIIIGIKQFVSDNSRRDSAIQANWLESNKYPDAKFVPTKIEGMPSAYQDGLDYNFKVTGDLTVRTTTKPITFQVTARLTGDKLTGKAVSELLLSDFGVGPISILGVLNTEDKVKITLDFVARP